MEVLSPISQTVLIGSSPNLIEMFQAMRSRPSLKTSQIDIGTSELWPFTHIESALFFFSTINYYYHSISLPTETALVLLWEQKSSNGTKFLKAF